MIERLVVLLDRDELHEEDMRMVNLETRDECANNDDDIMIKKVMPLKLQFEN